MVTYLRVKPKGRDRTSKAKGPNILRDVDSQIIYFEESRIEESKRIPG